jgi:hypothetical protein
LDDLMIWSFVKKSTKDNQTMQTKIICKNKEKSQIESAETPYGSSQSQRNIVEMRGNPDRNVKLGSINPKNRNPPQPSHLYTGDCWWIIITLVNIKLDGTWMLFATRNIDKCLNCGTNYQTRKYVDKYMLPYIHLQNIHAIRSLLLPYHQTNVYWYVHLRNNTQIIPNTALYA